MGAAWSYGIWSPAYAIVYTLATLPILGCIALITWESIEDRPYRLRPLALSFLLALTLARIAFVGLGRAATGYDWVNLVLGGYLAWMGALIGFAAPYARRWDLSLILGLFWIFQAFSSFGWTMNRWRWNWTLDPSGAIVAFLLIALRLRRPRNHGSMATGNPHAQS